MVDGLAILPESGAIHAGLSPCAERRFADDWLDRWVRVASAHIASGAHGAIASRENREGGETPPRAQRCDGDRAHEYHWPCAGKVCGRVEPQSEDRPGARMASSRTDDDLAFS